MLRSEHGGKKGQRLGGEKGATSENVLSQEGWSYTGSGRSPVPWRLVKSREGGQRVMQAARECSEREDHKLCRL